MKCRPLLAIALPAVCLAQVRLAHAGMGASQVLVVYNSRANDATSIKDAYLAVHPDIPAPNVFDLNDASIAGIAGISYADFVNKIRDPIRNCLDQPGDPSAGSIVSILLIRGIPHRIQDTDVPAAGDNPTGGAQPELNAGDYTAASVDSELSLLWQDLANAEAGGSMDSKSDNFIDNPYHTRTAGIEAYSRANIKNAKTLVSYYSVAWTLGGAGKSRLTEGDIYLVCRLDGNTGTDAIAAISRAQSIRINRRYAWVVLDEHAQTPEYDNAYLVSTSDPFYAGDDYEETLAHFPAGDWRVRYDATSDFIEASELPRAIIAYSSYGENHVLNPPGNGTYLQGFQFGRGAIFNTYESYNGRGLNGLGTLFNQEQVADFIGLGGTFGIANVWEPFAIAIPDNEFLFVNFLQNGLTWAESAWSAIPMLSWMHVVIGDPLATATIVNQPGDFDIDGDVDDADSGYVIACIDGSGIGPPAFSCDDADLDRDGDVDQVDFGLLQRCLSGPDATTNPPDPACAN